MISATALMLKALFTKDQLSWAAGRGVAIAAAAAAVTEAKTA